MRQGGPSSKPMDENMARHPISQEDVTTLLGVDIIIDIGLGWGYFGGSYWRSSMLPLSLAEHPIKLERLGLGTTQWNWPVFYN